MKTKDVVYMSMFTALTAAGAFIRIPVPVCPFTLQFFFTSLAGIILGGKKGALSVLCYIVTGLIGVPVFASGGGLGYIFEPTFGYLIGFCAGAFITGTIAGKHETPSFKRMLIAAFIGLGVVYLCGMIYYWAIMTFYVGTGIGLGVLFLYCFVLAVPGDIVLCFLAAVVGKRLKPALRRNGVNTYEKNL